MSDSTHQSPSRGEGMRPPRFELRRVALVLASLVASLLFSEAMVAVMLPQPIYRRLRAETPAMQQQDPIIAHSLRPSYAGRFARREFDTWVSINSAGFRGPELRTAGEPRVLVIGDSFTFGHGVGDNETFTAILDSSLDGIELVNGGFAAGSNPDMYYAWLSNDGLKNRFDGLLIAFFVGNDIDGHPEHVWERTDAAGLPTRITNVESDVVDHYLQSRIVPIGYRYPVLRNSHLFHLAGTVFRRLQALARPTPVASRGVFEKWWSEKTWSDVHRTQQVFEGIFAQAARMHLPVGIVMIPTLEQVRGEAPRSAQDYFLSAFGERRIPTLDLLPRFAGHPQAYFAEDQHWNVLGHRMAAAELARWYPRSGLPARTPVR